MPWIGGALSLAGGLLGSDAASDAADAQAASAAAATAEQRRQFDLNRADQAGFMGTGNAANRKLAQLMGLGGTPGGVGGAPAQTRDELRSQLLKQYTTGGTTAGFQDVETNGEGGGTHPQWMEGTSGTVDENGLNAAIEAQLAKGGGGAPGVDSSASDYGSLLKRFSTEDLNADPVYQSGLQFGLDQGTGAINARAIAGGGYDSGATLKALTRYANDYGSTKANESYNRFNTDQNGVYNKLAGVSGAGQQATNNVGALNTNVSQGISNLDTQVGNARGAGIIGGANAWGDALTGVGKTLGSDRGSAWLKNMMGGGPTSNNYQYNYDQGYTGAGAARGDY